MFCLSFTFVSLGKKIPQHFSSKRNPATTTVLSRVLAFHRTVPASIIKTTALNACKSCRSTLEAVVYFWADQRFPTDCTLMTLLLAKQATFTPSCFQMLNQAFIRPDDPSRELSLHLHGWFNIQCCTFSVTGIQDTTSEYALQVFDQGTRD